MTFLHPAILLGLLAVAAVALVGLLSLHRLRRSLHRFFTPDPGAHWLPRPRTPRLFLRLVIFTAALSLIVVALARPAHSPVPKPVQRSGRDVIFVIDVSRSMLAADLKPSRLERAKLAISDALDAAQGERIGLVAFAGSAVVRSPLTTDLAFTRLALDQLSPDSVGRGGTAIAHAIQTAQALLTASDDLAARSPDPTSDRFRDIFLFTDGEDHEGQALDAARLAAQAGIRIIAIGLGSDLAGASVPRESDGAALLHHGQRVQSKMNPDSLAQIAAATPGGRFFNVGTGAIEMDAVYKRLMRDAAKQTFDAAPAMKYSEIFHWFLFAALLLLCIEPLIPAAPRRSL